MDPPEKAPNPPALLVTGAPKAVPPPPNAELFTTEPKGEFDVAPPPKVPPVPNALEPKAPLDGATTEPNAEGVVELKLPNPD